MSENRERLQKGNDASLLAHYRGVVRSMIAAGSENAAERSKAMAWLAAGVPFLADALTDALEDDGEEDET